MRRRRRRRVLLVGGLIAYGTYKLTKKQAQQIEQHTGKPPEDLSDAEMDKAMSDLNIPKEPLTPEEQAQVDQQGGPYEEYEVDVEVEVDEDGNEHEISSSPVPVSATPSAPPAQQVASPETAPANEPSYLDEIERLANLRDQGILTDEEFDAKKKQLLGL